jgi:hypothetical protein
MRSLSFLTAAFLAASTEFGMAQQLPADCSTAAAPTQPLEVSINGTRFTPKSIKLSRTGTMKSGNDQFETYRLTLRSEDAISSPLEAEVAVVVRDGQLVDGKVFRLLPVKETGKQPLAADGLPEVQGWSFRSRPASLTLNHVRYLGSVRLEFGKRKGATIPGNVYLCAAKGQTSTFNKTPTSEDSYAIGTFEARVE